MSLTHLALRSRASVGLLAVSLIGACTSRAPLPSPVFPLTTTQDAPFRARPPAIDIEALSGDIPAPVVESEVLSNGMTLWVVSRPELPYVVTTWIAPRAGFLASNFRSEMLRLTVRTVVEGGTAWHDGSVVEPPAVNGQQVAFQVAHNRAQYSLRMLQPSLEAGLDILARTVREPAFGASDMPSVQLAEAMALQDDSDDLGALLLNTAIASAYGEDFADKLLPTDVRAARQVDVQYVRSCYEQTHRPRGSALVVVGATTLTEIRQLAEQKFGGWQDTQTEQLATKTSPPSPTSSSPDAMRGVYYRSQGRTVHFLMQAESEQADITILQPAPTSVLIEDNLPYLLLAHIAVGSLRSRSNESLRHEAGLTYGMMPRLVSTRALGMFAIQGAVRADELQHAVEELLTILENLTKAPVTEVELSRAKAAVAAELQRESGHSLSLASLLGSWFADGLDPALLRGLPEALEKVSAADVLRVAGQYLRPKDVDIAIAGGRRAYYHAGGLGTLKTYVTDLR